MKKKKVKRYEYKFNFMLDDYQRYKLEMIRSYILETKKPFERVEHTSGGVLRKLIDAEFKRLDLKLPLN